MQQTHSHEAIANPIPRRPANSVAKALIGLFVVRREFLSVIAISQMMLLALVWPARAVPPTNDRCFAAEVIPASAGRFTNWTAVTDITDATTNNDPPQASCVFAITDVSRSIWYSFTPVVTAFYSISSCANAPTLTSIPDTVMAIYRSSAACGGPYTEVETSGSTVGCADDSCGPFFRQAAITTELKADTTYYIVVWKYGDTPPEPGNSDVQLRVSSATPPDNDTCTTAKPLTLNVPVTGSTVLAGNDYQLSGAACFGGVGNRSSPAAGRDVVYSFTAPTDGNYSFKVQNYNPAGNLVVYVADSCTVGTPPVTVNCLGAANRNSASSAEEVGCLPLVANQTIFVFVDEDEFTVGSGFLIEATRCTQESEPNNSPATAGLLSCGIEGSINPTGDIDFYSLGAFPAGSRTFVMVDGSAANTTDFDLRVTTDADTLEFDERDNDEIFGALSPNIAGTPLPSSSVFLRVSYRSPLLSAEPYRMYAVVQPPLASATPETEPNNTLAEANAAENNYFFGSLAGPAPSTDVDVYALSAEAGELIFLSLDGDPLRDNTPINGKLELLDESGNVLVVVDDGGSAFLSLSSTNMTTGLLDAQTPYAPGEAIVFKTPIDGTYYARVSIGTLNQNTPLSARAGDYLLSISKNCFIGCCGVNNPPALVDLVATSPISENESTTLTGMVVDLDVSQSHEVVIDWGDGAPNTTISLPVSRNTFSAIHQYLDDAPSGTTSDLYTINVAATDNVGATGSNSVQITVNDVPPSLSNLAITSPISPNDTATLTGNLSDPGTLDTFTLVVDWGDGSAVQTTNLAAGVSSFSLTHLYTAWDTNLPVSLTLRDDDRLVTTASTNVIIGPPPARARFKSVAKLDNGHIRLQLQGTPGAIYRIETSADLKTWTRLDTRTADSEGMFLIEDAASPLLPQLFYRAIWP